jgi:pyruvate dehydrogenase E2 component (dihydrolipoamide acetyltransferase)
MADVAMPRLSDSMEEGTILKWLKSDGDEVSRGEELVEIETDKANMTYEADQDGALKIVAQEGDTLAVGETIAQIGGGSGAEGNGAAPAEQEQEEGGGEDGGGSEPAATATAEAEPPQEREEPTGEPATQEAPEPAEGENGRVKASPIARRMARELGLELGQLQGTGPGGRIVKADVEAASKGGEPEAAAPAEAPAAPEPEPSEQEEEKAAPPPVVSGDAQTGKGEATTHDLSRLQQTVARRMAESKATAPEFVLNIDVDMEEAVELRKQLKGAAAEGQPVPSFNDFVVKASALALRDFPRANGAYRDGKFELYSRVNVGVAVAGQDALVVPTVFDADTKSLGAIARDTRALAEHAARALVRHVHGLEPRHVRHPELRRRHQPAAGGDPCGRGHDAHPGRPRRRGRGAQHHAPHARLRPPHPLRRRRRRVPRPHPRAAREPAAARALAESPEAALGRGEERLRGLGAVEAAARAQEVVGLEAREHPQEVRRVLLADVGAQDALLAQATGEPRHAEGARALPPPDRAAGDVLAEG